MAEYSGVALSAPLDQMAVASGVGTAVDSGATAAVAAGDLVFGALITGGTPGGETPGTSNGVTYTPAASADSGSAYAEDITSAAAGPQNGTATLSTSTDWYAVAAAFLPVPAGAVAPAAPTNVAAPTVTSSNVTLSWTASTDNVPVTGYTVYRNGVQIGTTATTGYNDTTVAPSTAYSYTVTATNGAAQTSPASSPALPVTTPAAPPPSIAFVQGNTVTTGSQVASTTMPLTKAVGAGDLLVGWFSLYNGATGTLQVSDNVNGAWRRGPSSLAFQNDTGDIALYYKENSKASPSGVTITVASASGTGYLTGVVAEYSDVAVAGALDQMTTARAISTSIDTGLTGAADATELVYSAALIDASGTETITPGSSQGVTFTPRAQTSNGSAYEQDITAPAAGPQHGPATLGVSADWYAATVVFRQLPAGTTTSTHGADRPERPERRHDAGGAQLVRRVRRQHPGHGVHRVSQWREHRHHGVQQHHLHRPLDGTIDDVLLHGGRLQRHRTALCSVRGAERHDAGDLAAVHTGLGGVGGRATDLAANRPAQARPGR